ETLGEPTGLDHYVAGQIRPPMAPLVGLPAPLLRAPETTRPEKHRSRGARRRHPSGEAIRVNTAARTRLSRLYSRRIAPGATARLRRDVPDDPDHESSRSSGLVAIDDGAHDLLRALFRYPMARTGQTADLHPGCVETSQVGKRRRQRAVRLAPD